MPLCALILAQSRPPDHRIVLPVPPTSARRLVEPSWDIVGLHSRVAATYTATQNSTIRSAKDRRTYVWVRRQRQWFSPAAAALVGLIRMRSAAFPLMPCVSAHRHTGYSAPARMVNILADARSVGMDSMHHPRRARRITKRHKLWRTSPSRPFVLVVDSQRPTCQRLIRQGHEAIRRETNSIRAPACPSSMKEAMETKR